MKKCLVMMMVLGIASMATAGLSFTVGGADVDSIAAAGAIEISGTTATAETINWMVVADSAADSVTGGVKEQGALSGLFYSYMLNYFLPYAGLPASTPALAGYVADTGALSGLMFSGINITGNVTLLTSPDTITWTAVDTMVVPEPMTMGLLGLGGLFLRRRK